LNKAPDAFRTISEVADELDLPQHVLRFWESRFPHIKPMKRGGGRRYYRPEDVDLLRGIRHLLYGDGYTIRGVQRILREQGVRTVQSVGQGHAVNLPVQPREEGREEDDAEGARGIFKFLPRFSGGPAQAEAEEEQGAEEGEDEEREGDGPELDETPARAVLPEKRLKEEAKSPIGGPAVREPAARQVSASSMSVSPVAAPQVAAPQVAVPKVPAPQVLQATLPLVAPPQKGLGPEELERLKHALAELEACRRLLDKTNEGGR
jgi:DNA-binding transcriptional MerR regulator